MNKVYQSYYTKNNYITSYMVKMLSLSDNDRVFEPCGGDGAFIDELLKSDVNTNILTYDLDPVAISKLKEKYAEKENIEIKFGNSLFDDSLDIMEQNPIFEKVIGNPPYGAWLDYETRDLIRKKYKGYYCNESYSLFIIRCLRLLKDGGKLSFIIPDTYLFLNLHKSLRKTLLIDTKIEEILIFPSKFFPGVSFGYSNLSILTFTKNKNSEENLNNKVRVIKGFKKVEDLEKVKNGQTDEFETMLFTQKSIFENESSSFILDDKVAKLLNNKIPKLGDFADCVTGIYCGDNKRFIFAENELVKNSKGYSLVNDNLIFDGKVDNSGLNGDKHFIELIKSSSETKFFRKKASWFIDWSISAINYYLTDKKARFQNSDYYFKIGIALPMVKSSKINATIIQNKVFDQSIVGVFCKDEKYLNYILAFLNSDVANKLIHLINPTANNSANYLKRLPIIIKQEQFDFLNTKIEKILKTQTYNDIDLDEINQIFNDLYKDFI